MKISFDEYDRIEEICCRIKEECDINERSGDGIFEYISRWPSEEELRTADITRNFDEFFLYLMFYHTQDFTPQLKEDEKNLREYKKSMAYIRKAFEANLEFTDD